MILMGFGVRTLASEGTGFLRSDNRLLWAPERGPESLSHDPRLPRPVRASCVPQGGWVLGVGTLMASQPGEDIGNAL